MLADVRWLDTSDSGEAREVAGVQCEQVRQTVRFHQGDQPGVMGLLAEDTVRVHPRRTRMFVSTSAFIARYRHTSVRVAAFGQGSPPPRRHGRRIR